MSAVLLAVEPQLQACTPSGNKYPNIEIVKFLVEKQRCGGARCDEDEAETSALFSVANLVVD